ncbi:hypothetical protein K3495_g2514 [Podosphaera aphanis]|nr:hypothetical protein K3495_g2514 [Podosphaera aphanis]
MPCFKGIAVSVHAEGAPLPEYAVQKQSRVSRVSTYIPVPKPKMKKNSDKHEPSKFAISITLLTPDLPVPYSQPKPTHGNPCPTPKVVAGLPGTSATKGGLLGSVCPYIPITKSENETIAAYIYFDGRVKEEVATLLRPGEETWVNSRWVQLSNAEGGGLAEREFLFQEVALEKWLNGLDLNGKDAAAKIEKRRQKFENRRRRRKAEASSKDTTTLPTNTDIKGVIRYAGDETSPVERISDDNYSTDSDSDDKDPPEAAGQIKVAMFRVLASGEIKRGEYSPQFDAHDDEDECKKATSPKGDIDHTTSFAKPKTLDPRTVSTQTVTGIDGPDKPFAVFTFFYRGERQLQKMGIIPSEQHSFSPVTNGRRSNQLDFSSLAPLKPKGTVGFSTFREKQPTVKRTSSKGQTNGSFPSVLDEDSDEDIEDIEILEKLQKIDEGDVKPFLSPEDAKNTGEIADGVERIKLKRQHSAEPLNANPRKSLGSGQTTSVTKCTDSDLTQSHLQTLPSSTFSFPAESAVASPLKRHRSSVNNTSVNSIASQCFSSLGGDVVALAEASQSPLIASDTRKGEKI